jgi:hypothetical protein
MSTLASRVDATGGASPADRAATPATAGSNFDAHDLFTRLDLPSSDADGGYRVRTAAVYTVKRSDLLATSPLPARNGREALVGAGATGDARVSKEFDDLRMTDTSTVDDFRGLGKLAAWRAFGVRP